MQGIIIDTCNEPACRSQVRKYDIDFDWHFAESFDRQCLICKMDIFMNY
jgi:hypothetical protein